MARYVRNNNNIYVYRIWRASAVLTSQPSWRSSLSVKVEGQILPSIEAATGVHWQTQSDCQHRNMAASAPSKAHNRDSATTHSPRCHEDALSQSRDIIKPTITELTKEVRTNILCTVEGCGKILPNTPALNMHLVKSHRIKVNDSWTRFMLKER